MRRGDEAGLRCLLYFSEAHDGTTRNMVEVFAEILDVSQSNNKARRITGCLLACNGWFMQVLEGPGPEIGTTYASIERDPRHRNLRLVQVVPVNERRFPDWSMCGRALSATDAEIVDVLESGRAFNPRRLTPDRAIELLQRIQDVQAKHTEDRILLD